MNSDDKLGLTEVSPFDKLSQTTQNDTPDEKQEKDEEQRLHDKQERHDLGEEKHPTSKPVQQEEQESQEEVLKDKEDKLQLSADEDDVEDQEEGQQDDIEVNSEIDLSELKPFTDFFKENDFLPDDFEVTEKLSKKDLDNAILEHKKNELKEAIRPEVESDLIKYGYDPKLAEINKLRSYGVKDEDLQDVDYFSRLSSFRPDPTTDTYDQDLQDLGIEYYMLKGETEEEATRLTNNDLTDLSEDKLINRYTSYFGDFANKKFKEINSKVQEGEAKEALDRKQRAEKIENLLESRKINGKEYTKDQVNMFRDWMYTRDQVVELEDGRKVKMTKQEKYDYDIASNLEKALEARMILALNHDISALLEKAEIKGEKSLLDKLNNSIKTDIVKAKDGKRKNNHKSGQSHLQAIQEKLKLREV